MSRTGRAVAACALAAVATLLPIGTSSAAAAPAHQPWMVHASKQNACKLNLREKPDMSARALVTLSCENYTTCKHADQDSPKCGPYVVGGRYSCVGANGKQVTDNRWVEVTYRGPKTPTYAAASCAAFRH